MAAAFMTGPSLHAQSAYFEAVTNLSPAGYWPLNETVQPPAPFSSSLAAANAGSAGAAGNGYYGAWYQPNGNTWYITNNIARSNGVAGGADQALYCKPNGANNGQYVLVPRVLAGMANTNITLKPPFTIEAWVLPNATSSGVFGIVAEGGATVNYGGPNTNNPYYGGTGTGYAGVVVGQFNSFFLFDCFATNGTSKANELDSPTGGTGPKIGAWNHLVCTFDGSTETMWINDVNVKSKTVPANAAGVTFAPDLNTPLVIGTGPEITAQSGEGGINMNGVIDEVAIYNEVLPQSSIDSHFNAGFTSGYTSAVLSDNPVLYYQFNDALSAANAGYPTNTFPVATNYGTLGASADGVYQPGTTPGVAGPSFVGFGSSPALALNGWFGGVDVGSSNLPAALNPTGIVPMTVVSWFQGNPADAPSRYVNIVGHGNNSYRLALGNTAGENRFNPGPTEVQFSNAVDMVTNHAIGNDGRWHMTAGVSDGTNAILYLDGVPLRTNSVAAGINIAGSSADLILGGDSQFTFASYNTASTVRTFDGQIAQVAFWNTNLSTAQVQSMFNAAGVPPSIVTEPVGATNSVTSNVTVTAFVSGSQPISFQWYSNNVAVAGQTNENLVFPSATTNDIGNYYLVAASPYGGVTSTVASVFIYGAPAILNGSQSAIDVFAGSSPTLFVATTGASPILYQWLSNNVAIPGATNSSYTVGNATSGATYTVTAQNSDGSITGGPFTLTVLPDPTAPYPAAVLADHPMAFYRLDESSGTTAFDYVGGYNGIYTNTILDFSAPYNPVSDPTEGNAPGFGIATTNNSYVGSVPTNVNFAAPTNVNAEFSLECWLLAFNVKTDAGIISLGYGNGGEEFALECGGNDPAHDIRFYVRDAGGTAEAAVSSVPPTAGSVYHHVVAVCDEASGHVYLYIDGTNAATGNIPAKSGVVTSTQSLAIGSRQEGQGTQYDNQFIGSIDEVAIYNYALSAAQVQAHYNASGVPATIAQISPNNVTTNVGATVSFVGSAAGSAPFSYQWFNPNNTLISTNATLTLANVQVSEEGQYTFVVSNAYGSSTGFASLQVVLGPPTITQDISPLNQTLTLYSGVDSVSYTVVVSGSQPFSYQWFQDGAKVAGATNSTYSFTALPGTNTYYVTVTNAFTASQAGGIPAMSSTATIIGLAPPSLNPANYANRVKISFPGFTGQPLTNFPALITLNSTNAPGLEFSQFQSNGADLRFTDATGTAMLPFDIDEWNDGGTSTIWVQIPLLNGSNIWAYWGNSNPTDVPPSATNVWLDADYEIVYHLKESALPFADSTGQYPATNGVAPTPAPGIVGHGGLFDGTSDYLTPGAVTLSNQFTTYAWVNLDPAASDIKTVWANQIGGYGANGFSWFVDSYQTADRVTHFDSGNGAGGGSDPTGSNPVTTGQWHFMVATWDLDAGRATNYLDAVPNGSGAAISSLGLTNQLNLGAFLNPVFYWDGSLDEARIQSGIASPNWITTTYLNISQSSFVSYSAVNLAPMLSIVASTNGYILTWPANDGTFTLETTTNLAAPASWTAVTTPPPVETNGVFEQIVQPAAGSHFFRLQGQ